MCASSKIRYLNKATNWLRRLLHQVSIQSVFFEKKLTDRSTEARRHSTQHTADKHLFDGVRTASARHRTELQQSASPHRNGREKILADKAVTKTEFRKLRADIQTRIGWIQTSLDGTVVRASALDSKRIRLHVSNKSLKLQL